MLGRLESASIFGSAMPSGVHLRRLKENGGNGLADFASVEHLNLDRMVAELTKRMRDKYLLIDGVFYERCPEPVLAVFRTNVMYYDLKETAALVAVTTDPYPLNRVDSRAETFPIEDYMAALKMANRRNAGNRFAPVFAEINLQNLPEIDPHDSIYAADVAWMRRANRVAVEVAARLGELRASAMTDGLYSAYSRLVKALHTNEDDARFDTMAEIFAEVARECRGTDLDTLADHAESGLAVVEARPVSLNFGASSPVVGP
nr:hypothetical protein [Neorhizobium tomejilense]